jgi:hypothetical protein
LEPGVVHDLTLGVALQTEERYYLVVADSWDGLTLSEDGIFIEAEIQSKESGDPSALSVRFERPAASAE